MQPGLSHFFAAPNATEVSTNVRRGRRSFFSSPRLLNTWAAPVLVRMGNQQGGPGAPAGGGGGGPSSFRTSGKGKDVEEHIARSWRYKNEVKKLYMTEDEIKKKAAEEAPMYCREDRLKEQIQGLLGVSLCPTFLHTALLLQLTMPL